MAALMVALLVSGGLFVYPIAATALGPSVPGVQGGAGGGGVNWSVPLTKKIPELGTLNGYVGYVELLPTLLPSRVSAAGKFKFSTLGATRYCKIFLLPFGE